MSASRIVFHETRGTAHVVVENRSEKARLLSAALFTLEPDPVRAGERTPDFVAAPGLTVLNANRSTPVRIVRVAKDLPRDRESAYVLQLRLVPEKDPERSGETGRVKTVFTTFLKVFYRPAALEAPEALERAAEKLRWRATGDAIELLNPTPYWLTVADLRADGRSLVADDTRRPVLAPAGGRAVLPARLTAPPERLTLSILTDRGTPSEPIELGAKAP
ncbi:fimbrial biogenesis chaperone [Sutterella megalosphaeroides]|uniref:Fimbrial chaperone protein n=1 Tax=Sutterella megalosphaeroides TaxID=2494234 RepID=A0A2Z6IEN3_9BURK|nr:molecular chaperone [Sutterella megalosphaeroides]BBF23186.1 fimbrial chaperone protein [Sutterella megalosphaeroides]